MKYSFVILAARDISTSLFSETEKRVNLKKDVRKVDLDDDSEPSTTLNKPAGTARHRRCYKFILKPIHAQKTSSELVTAFEFDGPLNLPSSNIDSSSLEGLHLEIEAEGLDILHDVLLLRKDQCRVYPKSLGYSFEDPISLDSDAFFDDEDINLLLQQESM